MARIADEIRSVAGARIRKAREAGERTVSIRAGDIVRELHLVNRPASVCSALVSKRFLAENVVSLEKCEGPPSGLSTTTLFTYRIIDSGDVTMSASKFNAMRGAAKKLFHELGGGEEFLAGERQALNGQ